MLSRNRLEMKLVSGLPGFWRFVSSIPVLRRWVNRFFVNFITNSTRPRPHPLSLWGGEPPPGKCADYTSWTGLVDRTFSGRHLPPLSESENASLPPVKSLER